MALSLSELQRFWFTSLRGALLGCGVLVAWASFGSTAAAAAAEGPLPEDLPALSVKEGHFVNPRGEIVRFWGVNLVALYPTQEQAEGVAQELEERQVNLVRPHHLARESGDWNPEMVSGAILKYQENSRDLDPVALDRYDFLNAALRKRRIYLALSAHQTRQFLPGDVAILETNAEDRAAWMEAVRDMRTWHWKKSFDLWKSLPAVDERAALLAEEFVTRQLTHVNPYTGRAYAQDPQVLTMEVLNEASLEYAIICKNRFPAYFQGKLTARWEAFCQAAGAGPSDLYELASNEHKQLRADFLRQLDEELFLRIRKAIASTGSTLPVTFSNLWRGDNAAAMHDQHADWIENHGYIDPLVVAKAQDGILDISRNALAGKPFFVGELNQAEGGENIRKQAPYRTMLMPAMAAYGALQQWDGLVWFAWIHGGKAMGPDGRSNRSDRESHLGEMISDRMMQDHLRTMGLVFRRGLVQPSAQPVTLRVSEPYAAGDYHGLMRGKDNAKAGWQNIHAIRKTYGPAPEGEAEAGGNAPWLAKVAESPLRSDTGEILKDVERRQLTVAAPQVEILSGFLDGATPQGPQHLKMGGAGPFVTLAVVALDEQPLAASRHLVLSRTVVGGDGKETLGEPVELHQLARPAAGESWQLRITRPASLQEVPEISKSGESALRLPSVDWHECELILTTAAAAP